MELILHSNSVKGVPANVTTPDTFHCPICDKEKTNSLPANDISGCTFFPMGARFGADYGFLTKHPFKVLLVSFWLPNMSLDINGFSADVPNIHQSISCSGLFVNYISGSAYPSQFYTQMEVVSYGVVMSSGIICSRKPIV
jgi:hypothetical protein